MLKYLLFAFCLFVSVNSYSQQGQRPDSTMRNIPKTGMISGSVADASSGEPVEYASVAVYSMRDSSLVGGTLTDEKGKFTIRELPSMGRFKVKISFIGYQAWQSTPVMLNADKNTFDVGAVKLAVAGQNLNDVTITAEKNDFQNNFDRKVYNVDKNIVNTGGSATDVLQNIPSVTVDMDGTVALRGSGSVTVYIDGKPSTLTGGSRQAILQQIPANAIEQIEVITNPSAKYDAEGMAGIINIKTKKGKLKGFNGNTTVSVGTNNKYNASVGLNNRGAKLNVFGNYSFRSDERTSSGEGLQVYKNPVTFNDITTTSGGEQQNVFHTFKAGADYNINNENTIGISSTYTMRTEDDPQQITSFLDYVAQDDVLSIRNQQTDEDNNTLEGTLDYKRTFKDSKKELTASAFYSTSDRNDINEYFPGYQTVISDQKNTSDANFTSSAIQSDFVLPLQKSKLETGIKATRRVNDNDVHALVLSDGVYINDIQYTDHFIYEENILAAYGLYSGKLKSIDYSLGLRTEQSITEGDSKSTGQNISNDYLSFFPSAVFKYNFKKTNDLMLSYSRRINRPNINSLNPFADYSDTLNIRTGNPYVQPEYIQSLEAGYSKTLDKVTASATLYYRHTDDMIARYRFVNEVTGVSTLTPVNFSSADNVGIEGILRYVIKPGSLMWSFNLFQNTVDGKNIDPDVAGTNTNWNTRLTANMRVLKNFSFQVTGQYSAPDKQPNRTVGEMMWVDAGVKYEFWKSKASLGLNVNDIFDTREFNFHMEQDNYVNDSSRKRESRVGTLTFAYNFGSQDNIFSQRRKSKNPVQEGGGENNEGGF